MSSLFNFYKKTAFVTLGILSLALQTRAQDYWFWNERRNSERLKFYVLDSVVLPARYKAKKTKFRFFMARDSIFLICRPFCDSCNFIRVYDFKGRYLSTIALETDSITFDNRQNLPAWTGLWYFFSRNKMDCQPSFSNFLITESYIFAQNHNFWCIFSKTGKLLSQGYWRAYMSGKDICYTATNANIQLQQFTTIEGKDYFWVPISKNWPEFWKDYKKYYEYLWNYDFYNPNNYFLARYEIPKPKAGAGFQKDYSRGIEPNQVLVKLQKDWGSLKRVSEAMLSSIAVDSVKKLIYIAINSEHQVRIYDWEGNFKGWIGQKGKYLAPEDEFMPLPPKMAKGIDTINSHNWSSMLEGYYDYTYSMYKASYHYFLTRFDPLGGYLFRIYTPPDNAYKAYAKGVGVFPGFQNNCRNCKEYMQVICLKTGKVIYDQELIQGTSFFDILQVNAPGDYWLFGGYTDDYEYAKLYRVKMAVKEEE